MRKVTDEQLSRIADRVVRDERARVRGIYDAGQQAGVTGLDLDDLINRAVEVPAARAEILRRAARKRDLDPEVADRVLAACETFAGAVAALDAVAAGAEADLEGQAEPAAGNPDGDAEV